MLVHGRIGEALERLYRANIEPHLAELAEHFYRAAPGGNVEKAIDYFRKKGVKASLTERTASEGRVVGVVTDDRTAGALVEVKALVDQQPPPPNPTAPGRASHPLFRERLYAL